MYGKEASSGGRLEYDGRALMFPICSGCLDLVSVVMQMVAVTTSYWAHFKRERYPQVDLLLNTVESIINTKPDPLYEEGHYGLWSVCLTVFDGRRLDTEDCSANIIHFHPSSWRVFAGIIAIINVVLSLIFMAAIPLQFRHLKSGRPVYCKYKTLTRIKMVLSIVGAICGVMAAVLFGIHSHHKHYKEPKGWSFGLQIIVIIVQVFLIICSSAENVVAARIDDARPKPQFLFTVSGSNGHASGNSRKHSAMDFGPSFHPVHGALPANADSLPPPAEKKRKKKKKKRKQDKSEQLAEVVTVHDLSRDNPIYVDSEEDEEDDVKQQEKPSTISSSRFVVVKVADMYSEAYDNMGFEANEVDRTDSLTNTPTNITSVKVTNM